MDESNEKLLNEYTEFNEAFNYDEDDNSINEEILLDEQGENKLVSAENLEDFREKVKRSGVIYISHIPEGMTVNYLRERFSKYGVTRIYLAPENPHNLKDLKHAHKKKFFKEGWVEFANKVMGKLCEYELNGEVIGGKKNIPFREDLWTIKYLHKFKWHHLIEKMNFNKKLREQRMKAEIAQARREANFIEQKFEQSKIINKKNKKRQRDEEALIEEEKIEIQGKNEGEQIYNDEKGEIDNRFHPDKFKQFQRNFKQRKPIIKK